MKAYREHLDRSRFRVKRERRQDGKGACAKQKICSRGQIRRNRRALFRFQWHVPGRHFTLKRTVDERAF